MKANEAISKIKKCLALSKSANEHEAAAALRQAHALLRKFGISDASILIHDISEAAVLSRVRRRPPCWETALAVVVSEAFRNECFFKQNSFVDRTNGSWVFVGIASACEIASYAFDVLLRQLKRHRSIFLEGQPARLGSSIKTRRADLFCDAWVSTVKSQIGRLVTDDDFEVSINAYLKSKYPDLITLRPKNRSEGKRLSIHDQQAFQAGHIAGRNARLHGGVVGDQHPQLVELRESKY